MGTGLNEDTNYSNPHRSMSKSDQIDDLPLFYLFLETSHGFRYSLTNFHKWVVSRLKFKIEK